MLGSKKTVLFAIADGSEEIEALTGIDILRRAEADLKVVKIPKGEDSGSPQVTLSRDVKLVNF